MSILPFTFVITWLFKAPHKSQQYMLLCMILLVASHVLKFIFIDSVNDKFNHVYRVFETFLMLDALLRILLTSGGLVNTLEELFDWNVIGRHCVCLSIESVGYFCLVVAIEDSANPPLRGRFG